MKIRIKHNQNIIAANILMADDIPSRFIGLMFRSGPPKDSDGLLISPCNSIHTCFMKYSIDVVFMNSKNEVVKIIRALQPWRMTWIYFKASKTLELPAGKLSRDLKEGDCLEVEVV